MSSLGIPTMGNDAYVGEASPRASLWSRIFAAIVDAREREARRSVGIYLQAQGDERLAGLGFTADEVVLIHSGMPVAELPARRCRALA